MKEIREKFKLTDFFRGLEPGEKCRIYNVAYKPSVVRSAIRRVSADGAEYVMTEKGLTDCSEVTRVS
jgi:hypothetical protein